MLVSSGRYFYNVKYAKDARGALTSISRNCFALGQAAAPVLSGLLFTVKPLLPYALLALLVLCNVALSVVAGVPLFSDPPATVAVDPPTVVKATTAASGTGVRTGEVPGVGSASGGTSTAASAPQLRSV